MKALSQIFGSFAKTEASDGSVVGIDIGSSSIKVVELVDRKGVITLNTYGELQLGPYGAKEIGQAVSLEAKEEQAALVDMLREASVKAKEAVFAMPLNASFVTNVTFTADENVKLDSRVRIEARKVIPVSLSEVTLDWAEVEIDKKTTDKTERAVMIAAIQNEALARYKILLQFVGLPESPTEIECFSSIRGLYSSNETNCVIIDIGAISTKMYIVHNGLLARMHRVRAGGALATKRIASTLETSFEQAEMIKRSINRDDETFRTVQRAHHSSYERAFTEFRQVLDEYTLRNGVSIDTIYIAGGGALFTGTQATLQEALGIEVLKANPFGKVSFPAFMEDTMFAIGPNFSVAVGAALRQFE